MSDRLHPGEQGNRAMTGAMEPTFRKFLGEKTDE